MTNTYIMLLFVFFCLEDLYSVYLHTNLFLSLCIYHYHHKQVHCQILYLWSYWFFYNLLVYFLNSLLSLTSKDIALLLSKCLTYTVIWRRFIHNGLRKSSSVSWENGVSSSKRQNEKFEILWFENCRVLKETFCKILIS